MVDGYEFFANRQLVTLFSAPNYRGEYYNTGAVMEVDENLLVSFKVGMTSISQCLTLCLFLELKRVWFGYVCK